MRFFLTVLFLGLVAFSLPFQKTKADLEMISAAPFDHTPGPTVVNIPGSFQSELGCPGDWQPECAATFLTYDANDDVWQGTFTVPAGGWEYKAALNSSWFENYGLNAQQNGPNIPISLGSAAGVKFYYDHKSHWITSNRNATIAVAPGSFQSELGCAGDWDPGCLRSWLQDPDGDGIYSFETTALPAGNYETKVAINESWDENYGAGGVPNGANIQFSVPSNNARVVFSFSYTTKILTVQVPTGDIQWDGLRHNTFDEYYRSPFGAVAAGSDVTLRFRTAHLDVDGVSVRVYNFNPATGSTTGPVDLPMTFLENRNENGTLYDIWTRTITTPSSPAVLYYKFRVTDGADVDFYSDAYANDHDNLNQGGEGAASDNEPFPAFQITVYDPAFQTPFWLQNANVYQIFPDRFRNGDPTNDYCREGSTAGCPTFYGNQTPLLREPWNTAIGDPRQPGPFEHQWGTQFFGGDLKGIEDKLEYLQNLGIDTLYLNPIFKGRSNHRYDTDDFLEVDPALGGDAALASLKAAAERRGMRIILDGVFNHSSSDSVYFDRYQRYASDGACESTASQYRSWYTFFNNNVPCSYTDYEGWFGFDSLPVFRDDSAAVRDFFYRNPTSNVTKYWYDRGADGWRFDVANELSHNWWHEYRPFAKGYKPDGPLIGEIWEDASQYLAGDQLDSVMNYRFRKNLLGFARGSANWQDNDNHGGNTIIALTPSQFDHALRSVREDYPEPATRAMLNLIDSHDTNRSLYTLTLLGDNGLDEAKERLKLAALFQFTYMGAPMIYYGDEVAVNSPSLANGPNGPEDDPYNRAPYPWADEQGDQFAYGPADTAVFAFYAKLAHMRKQFPVLRDGSFETLLTGDTTASASDNSTYAFARISGDDKAVVALNNGSGGNTAAIPVAAVFAEGTQLQDALSGAFYTVAGGHVSLTLAARTGAVLLPSPAIIDMTSPQASISLSPLPNGAGWNNSPAVTINLSATDSGSGVKELRYWVDNGNVSVVAGAGSSFQITSEGVYTVYLLAIDNAGNVSGIASHAVRIDTTGPVLSAPAADPSTLLVPNHTMRDVAISYTSSDNLGTSVCTISSVTSNEPINAGEDGNTAPDWEIVSSTLVRLRAERSGTGTGRIYTVTVTCTDDAANSTSRSVNVTVPLKRR